MLALTVVVSGCWPVPGQNADRTGANPFETAITPETLAGLGPRWQASLGLAVPDISPVVSPAGVHMTGGCRLNTFDPSTGSTRWTAELDDGSELCSADLGTAPRTGLPVGPTQPVVVQNAAGSRVVAGYFTVISATGAANGKNWLFDAAGQRLAEIGFGGTQTVRGDAVAFLNTIEAPSNPGTWVTVDRAGLVPQRLRQFVVDVGGDAEVTLGDGTVYHSGPGSMSTDPQDFTRGVGVRAYSATEAHPGCAVDWLPDCRQGQAGA